MQKITNLPLNFANPPYALINESPLNVKTLAETLVKVYKGKVPKVVSNLREQAQKLEDEIPVYEKKVALLKRRVKIQELFYMAFFVCCIGIIIYFVSVTACER